SPPRLPNFFEVVISLVLFLGIMLSSIVIFDIPLQFSMFVVWFLFIGFGIYLGHSYNDIQDAIAKGIHEGLLVVLIFFVVGGLIGSWIAGGIVPSIIYYGLASIHPSIFLVTALFICTLTTLVIGTAWGAVGTVGIAIMAIGESFGAPLPLVAGVVLSGVTVGDKLSPISDSTVLTASLAKVNLMDHVKSMLYVSSPAWLITAVLLLIVGFFFTSGNTDMSIVENNMSALND